MTKFIDTKKWIFLKKGLDDFRNGLPQCNDEKIFEKAPTRSKTSTSTTKRPKNLKVDDDNSRLTLMQRQRIKNVEAIEHILHQHPLALYPNLEECLPPELFEDVVSILDPEITVVSEGDNRSPRNDKYSADRPATYASPAKIDDVFDNPTQESDENKVSNPYRWLPEMDELDKKDKKSGGEQQKNFLKSEDEEHIKNVTQQFCDWVASLGGDSNNIEESTITSLFASGYETKPNLSVPIHVLELASVPVELRVSADAGPSIPEHSDADSKPEFGKPPKSDRQANRVQYGAWYLEPKIWKKRTVGEEMEDPTDAKGKRFSEAKQKSLDLDYELAPMNGVKLFMNFVDKKDTRRPEFLNHVSEIQAEQLNEERLRKEAELAKQLKKLPGLGNRGNKR